MVTVYESVLRGIQVFSLLAQESIHAPRWKMPKRFY